MKKLIAKRLLHVAALIVVHVAAISGGVLLRSQTTYAQEETDAKWGRETVIDGLPACDCTARKVHECACITN